MGLSIHNIELMRQTQRKAELEFRISMNAMDKMSIAREQTELAQIYYSKLSAKNIAYYANGKYSQMNYSYLMGSGYSTAMGLASNAVGASYYALGPLKDNNSMILTDAFGLVVMSDSYADVIKKVLGSNCIDASGKGSTFSLDKIPAMIASIANCDEADIKKIIDDGELEYGYDVKSTKYVSKTTTDEYHEGNDSQTAMYKSIVNFFYPIFLAAAANGWTTQYNKEIQTNPDYVSDSLVTGSLQLAIVNSDGNYSPDTSLTYFVMSDLVLERTDSDVREKVTAWYNAEKERISLKEGLIDTENQQLSGELEAIKTEMESLKAMLEDDMKPFKWG